MSATLLSAAICFQTQAMSTAATPPPPPKFMLLEYTYVKVSLSAQWCISRHARWPTAYELAKLNTTKMQDILEKREPYRAAHLAAAQKMVRLLLMWRWLIYQLACSKLLILRHMHCRQMLGRWCWQVPKASLLRGGFWKGETRRFFVQIALIPPQSAVTVCSCYSSLLLTMSSCSDVRAISPPCTHHRALFIWTPEATKEVCWYM